MMEQRERKRSAEGEASGREMLLDAASALMIEEGTFDVSLHQIAKKAGLTAPLVKYYFGSKDGLLVALAQRDTEKSLAQLSDLVSLPVDPASKLRFHITGIIRTYAKHPYLNGLLDVLLRDDHSEGARAMRASFVKPLIDAQRQIIEEGVRAGQFAPVDPRFVYFLIVGACQYVFNTRVAFIELVGDRKVDDALVKDYASFVCDKVLKALSV